MPMLPEASHDARTPSAADRIALRVLQLGALLVVLLAAPYKQFDLDRFFVPKELVLHATALVVALLCLSRVKTLKLARVDQLLGLFLALGFVSALFATNWWLAGRAVAVSCAGAACFWGARALARRGYGHALVSALAVAGVLGAATALAQAYGLRTEYVSLNRAPGGTFGNRNFMAHLAVIVLPALVLAALRAKTRGTLLRWTGGLALISGALVMSRSRAAWLALIAAAVVLIPLTFVALRRGRSDVRLRRLFVLIVGAVAGAGLSLVIPNTLDWNSDSPYMDTAKSVVNYKEGSGAGRLVQYATTARMTLHHPLLGVGPGNWAVEYPHFAKPNDPSLADNGMTSNPWPSSDWMTFLSERGPAAFALLALAMLALVADGFRGLREDAESDDRLTAAVLLSTLVVLLVVGTFDAVLLLPVPALCAWALLGALSQPSRVRKEIAMPWARRSMALLLVAVLGGLAVAHSAAQLGAMALFSTSSRTSQLERASALDAGNYRIHMRLANGYYGRGNCKKARAHAEAAHALYPNAPAAKRLVSRCTGGD